MPASLDPVPTGAGRPSWLRERLAQAAHLARRNRRRGAPSAPAPTGPQGRAARPAGNRRRRGSRRAATASRGDPDGDEVPEAAADLPGASQGVGDHPHRAGSGGERSGQRAEVTP